MKTHIRWMIRRDMPEVLAIERACFDVPWTEEEFVRALRGRNCIGMVAEEPDTERVVGFFLYTIHKTHLQLETMAVAPEFQRKGIGRAFVKKLEAKAMARRVVKLAANVRETNLNAHLFFKAQGLAAVRVLRGLYEDVAEDAYAFEWRVPGASWVPQNRIAKYMKREG